MAITRLKARYSSIKRPDGRGHTKQVVKIEMGMMEKMNRLMPAPGPAGERDRLVTVSHQAQGFSGIDYPATHVAYIDIPAARLDDGPYFIIEPVIAVIIINQIEKQRRQATDISRGK